jgi:hypothetical protein
MFHPTAHDGCHCCGVRVLPSHGRTRFAPAWAGLADARSAARKAIALDDSNSEAHAALGWILIFKDSDFQEASYASMGQKDKAFEWLDKARAIRDGSFPFLQRDTRLDSLKSDPRFKPLADSLKNGGIL